MKPQPTCDWMQNRWAKWREEACPEDHGPGEHLGLVPRALCRARVHSPACKGSHQSFSPLSLYTKKQNKGRNIVWPPLHWETHAFHSVHITTQGSLWVAAKAPWSSQTARRSCPAPALWTDHLQAPAELKQSQKFFSTSFLKGEPKGGSFLPHMLGVRWMGPDCHGH